MRYIVSDIHGCFEEYKELLKKINFSDEDELYVLGDSMDRGPEPIKVIQDIMSMPNAIYILGNHDFIMLRTLKNLMVECTEDNLENHLSVDDMRNHMEWLLDGGETTSKQFTKLSRDDQWDILEFLENSLLYEVIEHEDCHYILVHAGIDNFENDKSLEEYDFIDFIFTKPDYSKRYFKDEKTFLVTGHTPTASINKDERNVIYRKNNHIAIDCGCVFGGKLSAYCIETGESTYIDSKRKGSI